MHSLALPLLLLVSPFAAAAPAPFPKSFSSREELRRMQGTWILTRYTFGGAIQDSKGMTLDIVGNRATYRENGVTFSEWEITLDHRTSPRSFTFSPSEETRSFPKRGVYRIEGDVLILCGRRYENARDRPTNFDGTKADVDLEVFHRKKPSPPSRR